MTPIPMKIDDSSSGLDLRTVTGTVTDPNDVNHSGNDDLFRSDDNIPIRDHPDTKGKQILDIAWHIYTKMSDVRDRCAGLLADLSDKKTEKSPSFHITDDYENTDMDTFPDMYQFMGSLPTAQSGMYVAEYGKCYVDEDLAERLPEIKQAIEDISDQKAKDVLSGFIKKYEKLQIHERELLDNRLLVLKDLREDILTKVDEAGIPDLDYDKMDGDPVENRLLKSRKKKAVKRLEELAELTKRMRATDAYFGQLRKNLDVLKSKHGIRLEDLDSKLLEKAGLGPVEQLQHILELLVPDSYNRMGDSERIMVIGGTLHACTIMKSMMDEKLLLITKLNNDLERKQTDMLKVVRNIGVISNIKKDVVQKNDPKTIMVDLSNATLNLVTEMEKVIAKVTTEAEDELMNLKAELNMYTQTSNNPTALSTELCRSLKRVGISKDDVIKHQYQWEDNPDEKSGGDKLVKALYCMTSLDEHIHADFRKTKDVLTKPTPVFKLAPSNQLAKFPQKAAEYEDHLHVCSKLMEQATEAMSAMCNHYFNILDAAQRLDQIKLTGKFEYDVIRFDLLHPVTFDEVKERMLGPDPGDEHMCKRWLELRKILDMAKV